ncbi:Ig-like domain repeat protein [Nocardioides dubius]|uniref:Bacterial Ig-like domain-containing protein n=1 Tax=Nocardioides dubius TaxID=317019 RepID=A0ABN1U0X0_9ACTN
MSASVPLRASAVASIALVAGLFAPPPATATLDATHAGAILAWGRVGTAPLPLPEELATTPVSQAIAAGEATMALTTAGKVIAANVTPQQEVPAELADETVKQIAFDGTAAAALTADGELVFWGDLGDHTTIGGVDLSDLTSFDLGTGFGVGLTSNGTVVAWGNNADGRTDVPGGLTNVVKVDAGSEHAYALRADGTVVGWGRNQQGQVTLPADVTVPGAVQDIVARAAGGLALMTDGTLRSWGQGTTGATPAAKYNAVPAAYTGSTFTQIASTTASGANLAVDSTGAVRVWGSGSSLPADVPAGLDGNGLSQISLSSQLALAIQRKVMTVTASTLAGTAKQGSTLTGTPATFSGTPEISHQWLADGTPIAGATGTSLALTSAQVGKRITFRTIATDSGTPLTSDSPPSAAVAPLVPPKVSTRTTISKVRVKRTTAAFTVKVTRSGGTPTGKVTVQIKRGAKKVYRKTVSLRSGAAKVTVKRLKKGRHTVTASYLGDSRGKSSSAKAQRFRIR